MKYSEWIKTKFFEGVLPSGLDVTIRKFTDLLDLASLGTIPMPLLTGVVEAVQKGDGDPFVQLVSSHEFLIAVAKLAIVEPKELNAQADLLSMTDLNYIMEHCLGVGKTEDIKSVSTEHPIGETVEVYQQIDEPTS